MYNSSIKGQGKKIRFVKHLEVPHKIFFNDMSKQGSICAEFRECDMIYSEIAWRYGYKIFNENAGNVPNIYAEYCININNLVEELKKPAFIVCGKQNAKFFPKAQMYDIDLVTSGTNMPDVKVFVWNYDYDESVKSTTELLNKLALEFQKPLDFSCGYGEHLLKFKDFVACDIDRDCLTYLSIIYEQEVEHGKHKLNQTR